MIIQIHCICGNDDPKEIEKRCSGYDWFRSLTFLYCKKCGERVVPFAYTNGEMLTRDKFDKNNYLGKIGYQEKTC